jgi:hypothetical protein
MKIGKILLSTSTNFLGNHQKAQKAGHFIGQPLLFHPYLKEVVQ